MLPYLSQRMVRISSNPSNNLKMAHKLVPYGLM
jgi:hypothetical protein